MNILTNQRIYIVDDDCFFAKLIQQTLINAGCTEVEVFNSGKEFLSEVYKNPALVILDYQLGDSNGLELLKFIKNFNSDIQVIFLSGQKTIAVATEALKYGAFDYIEKEENVTGKIIEVIDRMEDVLSTTSSDWKKPFKRLFRTLFTLITCLLMLSGCFYE